MLTEEGQRRADDALLASVMRKLLADQSVYVDAWPGRSNGEGAAVLIDGEAAVTPEEAAAVRKVADRAGG